MAKLFIDGKEYAFSSDYDLGEARIIKRYTGLNLQQLEGHDPTDPDLIAACIHIAFLRDEPSLSFADVEARVNKVKLARIEFEADEEGASPDPPEKEPSDAEQLAGLS